jgi:8-oxo-dGTP pyrophosphatase MutT (NUDIX family)
MVHRLDMEELRVALQQELPGDAAKARWQPHPPRRFVARSPSRAASVLALLVAGEGDLRIPLMRRREVAGDVHSGQISLPGGRQESGEDLARTALRETREELGIEPDRVDLLGTLSLHRIPVSAYDVTPYVGWIQGPIGYWRDPREVELVFEVSLGRLLDPDARVEVPLQLGGSRFQVPGWQLDEGLLWGATAMILGELLELLSRLRGR